MQFQTQTAVVAGAKRHPFEVAEVEVSKPEAASELAEARPVETKIMKVSALTSSLPLDLPAAIDQLADLGFRGTKPVSKTSSSKGTSSTVKKRAQKTTIHKTGKTTVKKGAQKTGKQTKAGRKTKVKKGSKKKGKKAKGGKKN